MIRWSACLLAGLLVLLGSASARAAEPATYQFERLADELGGRMSSVYEIVGDPAGFIWFAGDTDGLLRYDGYEFMVWATGRAGNLTRANVSTVLVTPQGRLWIGTWGNGLQYWDPALEEFVTRLADADDPDGLADNRVQRMLLDRSGRLWIGTTAGVNFIDPAEPSTLRRFARDEPVHPLFGERIWGMAELNDAIWFATSNGLYRIRPGQSGWDHYLLNPIAAATEERGAEVRTVSVANGQVWAGGRDGVYRFDPAIDRFVRVPFVDHDPIDPSTGTLPSQPTPRVNALLRTVRGDLLVGAHDGLYRIDIPSRQFVRQGERFNQLPDVDVRVLHEDAEGNLWIGTRDNGIIQGRHGRQIFTQIHEDAPAELRPSLDRLTSAVHFDADGNLWLGVPDGVARRAADGNWQFWPFPDEFDVRRIERIRVGVDGRTWLATSDGLFEIDPESGLQPNLELFERLDLGVTPVNELWIEDDGTLWLALWNFGVVRWQPGSDPVRVYLEQLQSARGDFVYHLDRDASGHLWAATRYSGVFRLVGDRFEAIKPNITQDGDNQTYTCAVPDQGAVWLCREQGLILYRPDSGESQSFGPEDGLPSRRVTSFLRDHDHGDWVLTPQGLGWRPPGQQRFLTLGLRDGLPALSLQRNAIDRSPTGHLVLGTAEGAVRLHPDALPRDLPAPRAVLSRLWIEGEDRTRSINPVEPRIDLSWDNRDLMMQLAVLDLHDPERNRLRYRLTGFDNEFGPLTGNRTVRYFNLPPGQFTLQVQPISSRGVIGDDMLEIPIVVATPWWQSPLTWLLASILLLALVLLVIRLRLRALQLTNERLQAEVAARTRELEQANQRLGEQAITDPLTGLCNRRGVNQRFVQMRDMLTRNRQPLALVLFDLDHFKQINDSFGHDLGDEVLRTVGSILVEELRAADIAARWGGEEFLLALPDTRCEDAREVCERIRARLAGTEFDSATA
ncbi:MAG: diguanylate cyclase [Wenzhouxiangellaceae bacterium]|nr:diguanylate cyclase [Wenzhouxiangellaceae bacterium]